MVKETLLFLHKNVCTLLELPWPGYYRGIKHDFPFINIRKVPREVLKTEGEARGFQPSRGTLRMLMNDKIMFDRYYCINSTKHCENEKKYWHTIFYSLTTFSYASTLCKIRTSSRKTCQKAQPSVEENGL